MDLREVARLAASDKPAGAILAPFAAIDSVLAARIAELREQGEIVVERLPGETLCEGPLCNRNLVEYKGQWIIQDISGID
jgi:ATP phosphoribosyltransferase regulatory subunit